MTQRSWFTGALIAALAGCGSPAPTPPATDRTGTRDEQRRSGRIVSAFFGLDNALPRNATFLCPGAAGRDGMPVVLSLPISQGTLEPEDFLVITQAGISNTPFCVTLAPAVGAGELRTVLLVGEFGGIADPPATVRVVGDILSDEAQGPPASFRGAEATVIPLVEGPTLVWAEDVPRDQWTGRGFNAGTSCPPETMQIVRVTWAGGIRLPSGDEVGDTERALYRVTVRRQDGSHGEVVPFALADLNDNDNNHSLCLKVSDTALAVSFPAGHVVDPNRDLNPQTEVAVTR